MTGTKPLAAFVILRTTSLIVFVIVFVFTAKFLSIMFSFRSDRVSSVSAVLSCVKDVVRWAGADGELVLYWTYFCTLSKSSRSIRSIWLVARRCISCSVPARTLLLDLRIRTCTLPSREKSQQSHRVVFGRRSILLHLSSCPTRLETSREHRAHRLGRCRLFCYREEKRGSDCVALHFECVHLEKQRLMTVALKLTSKQAAYTMHTW
jgi:hypothetical protein